MFYYLKMRRLEENSPSHPSLEAKKTSKTQNWGNFSDCAKETTSRNNKGGREHQTLTHRCFSTIKPYGSNLEVSIRKIIQTTQRQKTKPLSHISTPADKVKQKTIYIFIRRGGRRNSPFEWSGGATSRQGQLRFQHKKRPTVRRRENHKEKKYRAT